MIQQKQYITDSLLIAQLNQVLLERQRSLIINAAEIEERSDHGGPKERWPGVLVKGDTRPDCL